MDVDGLRRLLKEEDGLWTGVWAGRGSEIEVCVAGTERAPDPDLLAALAQRLAAFDELAARAIAYVQPRGRDAEPFEVVGFVVHRPRQLTVELALGGDEHAIWRVEFDGDQPIDAGRDS